MGYSLCGIFYSLVFCFAEDWRKVFYILIGFSFITLLLIWIFIYDSPRAFINKKDYKTTIKILEGIASFHGKLEEFRESIKSEEYQDFISKLKGEKAIEIQENEIKKRPKQGKKRRKRRKKW